MIPFAKAWELVTLLYGLDSKTPPFLLGYMEFIVL